MKPLILRYRTEIAVLAAVVVALAVWSALGGQPLASIKYKAAVVGERASSVVKQPSGRIHPKTTAATASLVGNTGRPQLVDFYAEWCPNCRALAPGLHELKKKYEGAIDVVHVDIDSAEARGLLAYYPVNAVPTLYLLDPQGKPTKVMVGGVAPEILDRLLSEL